MRKSVARGQQTLEHVRKAHVERQKFAAMIIEQSDISVRTCEQELAERLSELDKLQEELKRQPPPEDTPLASTLNAKDLVPILEHLVT